MLDFVDEKESILYCKADGSYTRVCLISGQQIVVCQNLKGIEQFISDQVFIRCHQSFLVNSIYIEKIDLKNHSFVLVNGYIIPIARRRVHTLPDFRLLFKGQ